MSYLLDTCVISEMVKSRPNERVVDWMAHREEDSLHLSVLTLGEIHKGIAKLPESSKKQRLLNWVNDDLRSRFSGRILAITELIACQWGLVLGEAERKGHRLPVIDSLLAATGILHDLTVVTRNTVDIERSGARVFNPWLAPPS